MILKNRLPVSPLRTVSALAAAMLTLLPLGCSDKSKNDNESSLSFDDIGSRFEATIRPSSDVSGLSDNSLQSENAVYDNSLSSDRLIVIRSSDAENRAHELEYRVISMYKTYDIAIGDEHVTPDDGMTFYVAELELINDTDEQISFRCIFDVIPSINDRVISLDSNISKFPLVMHGFNNLQCVPELPVYSHSSLKGYIAFEGPDTFSSLELSFQNEFGIVDSYHVSANENSQTAVSSPDNDKD